MADRYFASIDSQPLTFVDVETTGLSPWSGHRVCEIALVRFQGDQELSRFVSLVNPRRPISPGAAAVNHLTDDMVRSAPTFATIADQVHRLLSDTVVVAHNAPFDLSFLSCELGFAGRANPKSAVIDTLALARRCFTFPSNSLGSLAGTLGVAAGGHRALGDVLTTHQVFGRLVQRLRSASGSRAAPRAAPLTLEALLQLQGGPIPWPASVGARPSPPSDLQAAIETGARLEIHYLDSGGQATIRQVDPISLSASVDSFHLVAHCHLRGDQRTFRVDRILRWRVIGNVTSD